MDKLTGVGTSQREDAVSPTLAAQIVKNYILPMFETDERKLLKSKYNKMAGIRAATGNKLKSGGRFKLPDGAGGASSVYGELKLSEKLASELDQIKSYVDELHESFEEAVYERDELRVIVK